MIATDTVTGETFEVFQCGNDCVRDEFGRVYHLAASATPFETECYRPIEDPESAELSVPICECNEPRESPTPGADIFHDYPYAHVCKCDLCDRFRSDEDACLAYVSALNCAAGKLHFVMVIKRERHYWIPAIALASSKGTPVPLTHAELEAERLAHCE